MFMAVISWDGTSNLDLKVLGRTFDLRSDVLQISDPTLQANQFDLVENGTDLAIVKSRDATGAPLPAADVTYAYIPNMLVRQVGGTDASPVSSNIVLSNGGQLWVGDRLTDTLLDDAGNDATALSTVIEAIQVFGLGGADTIVTGSGADRIYGNKGEDFISGGAGNDSLYGGQENDTVSGGGGNDNVAGDLGNDMVNGGSGNDILYGGAGNDILDPDTGNDTLFAGNGNDTVTIGDSDTGDKLVYMDRMQDQVNILFTPGDHVVYLGDDNDHASLEANSGDIQVFGQDGDDLIRATNASSDTLDGGNGADSVMVENGAAGDKLLIGGFGDDYLRVEDFFDAAGLQILPKTQVAVSGGEGDDVVEFGRGVFITDAIDGGAGDDRFQASGQTILSLRDQSIENVESVHFSGNDDSVIFADGNVDVGATLFVSDFGGADLFDGSRETDGHFVIDGGSGGDTLTGGALADTIIGGFGSDLLRGNGGADVFRNTYSWNSEAYPDVIQDFTGGVDKLAFDSSAFSDVSAIDGYKGSVGDNATAGDNLLIGTDNSYSIGSFDTFLSVGTADTDKPGFYIFFNATANRGEIWFDTSMVSTDGAVLIATFNNITAANQLAQFDEGPNGSNSGDFVVDDSDPPNGDTDPPDGDTDPPDGDTDPPDGDTDPPDGDTDPPDGDTDPPDGDTDPPDGDTDPPDGDTDPPDGDTDPPDGDTDPPDGDPDPPDGDTDPPDGDTDPPDGDPGTVPGDDVQLTGGEGADTLQGSDGPDLLTGNGGADVFRHRHGWNSEAYPDVIQDFTGGLDKLAFDGNAFSDVSAIDGYRGTAGDSATANDNLLIATGAGYSIGSFDTFLSVGAADTDKPGFYIFFNAGTSRGEIWFDTSMVSTDGARLIATFNNITAVNQLAQFDEGANGGNSGDFIVGDVDPPDGDPGTVPGDDVQLTGGEGADTLQGSDGPDLLTGNGGADVFRHRHGWNSEAYPDVIQDFTGGLDKLAFDGNAFSDVSAIDGYRGTAGDSATANDNLLIATGTSYSIGSFDTFLSVGAADTDKPGFYIFFNAGTSRGEIWFDTSMISTDGARLIATFNNITAINQLSQFDEGPNGGNSGDFVII
ncbi:hypothetical protein STAQ_08720 [Allostella sp. ATCC 35155]|nr:hypothetical protein STAQ_08720 [Stella sp. ATCC 35155]